MPSRRAVTVVLSVIILSVLPTGTPPAMAFAEGASDNYFGTGAGAADAGGDHNNSFFGGNAGKVTTSGVNNAFFGLQAGLSNTAGDSNSFFGTNAGLSNTTGFSNTFVGLSAGFSNTEASSNAFFGQDAGFANTTGSLNAFFGSAAGRNNTEGLDNAFFGTSAGFNNITGDDNAFFGRAAGFFNTTGANNSFFGLAAGQSNTTGNANAFFGHFAGVINTAEDANSYIGAFADGAVGITNASAIGHRAQVAQSNSLVLGSINGFNGATSNVNVGMGTPFPQFPLHVRRADGTAKVLVEEASGTLLGRELFQLTNNGAARFRVSNTSNGATWDFQSSSGGGSFVIDRVGGPVSLDFEVQPDGDLVMRGSVTGTSFISSSDRNLKTDITPANAAKLVSLLRRLDISTWRFKTEPEGTVNLGPMAQDFHRLFGMGTETTIDVRNLAALALVAVQALDDRLTEVETAN